MNNNDNKNNENEKNENKIFPKITIKKKDSSSGQIIQIKKSQTKQEESIISDKTRDTNKYSGSLIPSISPFSSFKTLSDDSQINLQDFLKNGKKEIIFSDSSNKEILLSSDKKKIPKIIIKDSKNLKKSQTSEENNSNNSSLKENDYQKKKQLYEATKYLDILSSTLNEKNYNFEEDDNEIIINNDDYVNIDEVVSNNQNHFKTIKNSNFQKTNLTVKDKNEIENIRKIIENKLGKDFTRFIIKYISDNTNKELFNFDQKKIEEKLKKDYENKILHINANLLKESIILLPEIYSIIVANRMEENK